MISLPLWLHLCYYMIYSNSFVSSVEESKIGNDQSLLMNQSTRLDGNIKGSNINEINTQEHSHSSEETRDSASPVSNQSFKTTRPKSDMLIDLDIKTTKSRPEFDFSEKGNVVTYTPKEGYGFYVVKEGKAWWKFWCSDNVIWESRFRSQYLNKVVVESGSDEQKTLTIHLVDGTTKVYKKPKDGDFSFQNDDSSKDSKPADPSRVTETPTTQPSSEQKPTETPEETKDSTDPVSQEYEGLELNSSAPTETPTDNLTSKQGATETPEETKDSTDSVSKQKSETSSPEVKLVEVDIEKTNSTTEFDYAKNNVVTYTPKAGYAFGTVKIGKGSCNCLGSDKVVWEAENESKHSNKVVVESGSDKQKTLTIHCVDGTKKVYKKVKDGDFTFQNDDSSKDSKPGDSSVVTEHRITQPSSEQEHTQTPEETKDSTDSVSKQKSETSSPEVKLVEVDIEKTNSTTEFDYAKNNVVTYTPKAGYAFGTVKIGKGWKVWNSDKIVWEAENESKHSNKVVVETGSNEEKTLTIDCFDKTTKVYKKVKDGDFVLQNEETSDTPIGEVKLIDLDIKKSESTAEFSCAKNGRVTTYTPKQGYGFGTVKKGKGSCDCCGSDEIIWEAKDKTQASNKVITSQVEKEIDSDLFLLEIYKVDNSTLRYFNSDSPNSPYYKKWVQRYDNVDKELHPSEIKIYTKDETNDKPVENDTSKYTVDIFKKGEASKYGYRIKKGVKCTKVQYNNNEVWNDTENTNHKNIDRLIYDQGDKKIILEHNGFIFKTYEIPDEPKQK